MPRHHLAVACLLAAAATTTGSYDKFTYEVDATVAEATLDPDMTADEQAIVDRCLGSTQTCSDMLMRIDRISGCSNATGSDAGSGIIYCEVQLAVDAVTFTAPPLTVIGRGFGTAPQGMRIGNTPCDSISVTTGVDGRSDLTQVVCETYNLANHRDFTSYVTVTNQAGQNITGPAAVQFGPGFIYELRVNDSDACVKFGPETYWDYQCYSNIDVYMTGYFFPNHATDIATDFLGPIPTEASPLNGPFDPNSFGVAWKGYEEEDGLLEVRDVFFEFDANGFVQVRCTVIIDRYRPGIWIPHIWWGPYKAHPPANLPTFTAFVIMKHEPKVDGVYCGDQYLPVVGSYSGDLRRAYADAGVQYASVRADDSSNWESNCTSQGELLHLGCCNSTGHGQAIGEIIEPRTRLQDYCSRTYTYTAAKTQCEAWGYRLCTRDEIMVSRTLTVANTACTGASASRLVWAQGDDCTVTMTCGFSEDLTFRGRLFYKDIAYFTIGLLVSEAAAAAGNTARKDIPALPQWVNELRDPVTNEPNGTLSVRIRPLHWLDFLARSGIFELEFRHDGDLFKAGLGITYLVEPKITAVKGCYDVFNATTRCPSNGATLLLFVGENLDAVREFHIGSDRRCADNITAHTTFLQTFDKFHNDTHFFCSLLNATVRDYNGWSSPVMMTTHWQSRQFTSDSTVSVTFAHRPVIHRVGCTNNYTDETDTDWSDDSEDARCPTLNGRMFVVGEHLDTLVYNIPGDRGNANLVTSVVTDNSAMRLFIGRTEIECYHFAVTSETYATCEMYDVTQGHGQAVALLPELYNAADPLIPVYLTVGVESNNGTNVANSTHSHLAQFKRVPYISSLEGCDGGCNVRFGAAVVTVHGGNFTSADDVEVRVDGTTCTVATVLTNKVTCRLGSAAPDVSLETHHVQLVLNGEISVEAPELLLIANCDDAAGRECSGNGRCSSEATCMCEASPLRGYWVGLLCEDCNEYYYGGDCRARCDCPSNGYCLNGTRGSGACKCHPNYYGAACSECPGFGTEVGVCGGHGRCRDDYTGDGVCLCEGNWSWNLDCLDCNKGYYGASCDRACPGGVGNICNGHGECDSGRGGNGSCTCERGYGGAACEAQCPGTRRGTPCFGHGECDAATAACACHQDDTRGFWAGGNCTECLVGYSGSRCLDVCPTNATTGVQCSGHGQCGEIGCLCDNGYCGLDCSLSDESCQLAECLSPTRWGSVASCPVGTCGCECPTFEGEVCNGIGFCSAGEFGTGKCTCLPGITGPSCQYRCPDCVAGRGECVIDGTCKCSTGYAGALCDIECPGRADGVATICGGNARGYCDDGRDGTGECRCAYGYTGTACLGECPGGATNPCTGHGVCTGSGCTCERSATKGYWDGEACASCLPPYVPPFCNETCPGFTFGNSFACSGHGLCDALTRRCDCERTPESSWKGDDCSVCQDGFFGANCDRQCTGGACNPCFGHGVCNDGLDGDGVCTCVRDPIGGLWGGQGCEECKPDYYGLTCTLTCPGFNTTAGVCNRRGRCRDGRDGDGRCVCSVPGQKWTGTNCDECQPGFFGDLCDQGCPSDNDFVCSGHGSCGDGVRGVGACTCDVGYVGETCGLTCPGLGSPLGSCGGHGLCSNNEDTGIPECQCGSNPAVGYWDPEADCTVCAFGFYGESCNQRCPGDNDIPCSGRGLTPTCDLLTGKCDCQSGWAGAGCEIECDGGSVTPCSFHGECDALTGRCKCHASPTLGYWTGAACGICHPHFTSVATGCNLPCPLQAPSAGAAALPCSGYGVCIPAATEDYAVCIACSDATATRCGEACQISGTAACQQYLCGGPRWGAQCENWCPGSSEFNLIPCNGHGYCGQGKTGSGVCICDTGYVGSECELKCPDCTTGRGTCNEFAMCDCIPAFGGQLCNIECPGGFRSPCGIYNEAERAYELHGVCNDGSAGDGTCSCFTGWRGEDCNTRCAAMTEAGLPCNGHGDCLQFSPICACHRDDVRGHWAGDFCDECAEGYVGENCTDLCLNGRTAGRECRCDFGWFGIGCNEECPGRVNVTAALDAAAAAAAMGSDGDAADAAPAVSNAAYAVNGILYCNTHGICVDGFNGTGECVCDTHYYGPVCETHCIESVHCSEYVAEAVTCGASGCECVDDDIRGHRMGSRCQYCKAGWWGPLCLQPCQCNGNAYDCDRLTGACACYLDAANGYYQGETCNVCASGYIGARCRSANVAITRAPVEASAPRSIEYAHLDSAVLLTDTANLRVIACASPPAVFDLSEEPPQYDAARSAEMSILSDVRITGAVLYTDTVELWTTKIATGEEVLYVYWRQSLALRSTIPMLDLLSLALSHRERAWGRGFAPLSVAGEVPLEAGSPLPTPHSPRGGGGHNTTASAADNPASIALEQRRVFAAHLPSAGIVVNRRRAEINSDPPILNAVAPHRGTRRAAALLQTASDAATLRETVSIGPMWCAAFQLEASIQLTLLSSSGPTLLHSQEFVSFDTFAWMKVVGDTNILVAGSLNGVDDAMSLDVDLTSGVIRSAVTLQSIAALQHLYPMTVHTAVGLGRFWFLGVKTKDASTLRVLKVDVSSLYATPPVVNAISCASGAACATIIENTDERIEKIAIDEATGELYVSVAPASDPNAITADPSWVFRVDYSTMNVTGSTRLTMFAGQAEVVRDVAVIPSSNAVFVLPATGFLRLITLNTYFVDSVVPSVADSQGGVLITILGRGFRSQGAPPLCRIKGKLTKVVLYNQTAVICEVPPSSTGSECVGGTVDVSFSGPDRFTNNDHVRLRRVYSATPIAVSPSQGGVAGGTTVTITGYGFDHGGFLSCEFFDTAFRSAIVRATFISPTVCTCVQPSWPQPSENNTYVRLSQDGTTASPLRLPYAVVGRLHAVEVTEPTASVVSKDVSPLPPLNVYARDIKDNRVFPLLSEALDVTVHKVASCANVTHSFELPLLHNRKVEDVHFLSNMPFASFGKGHAVIEGLYFRRPKTGFCTVTVLVYDSLPGVARNEGVKSSARLTFRVLPGEGVRLEITQQPDPSIRPENQFVVFPHPTLVFLDIAGNRVAADKRWMIVGHLVATRNGVREPSLLGAAGRLSYYYQINHFANEFECLCDRITVPEAVFGVEYSLEFAITDLDGNVTLADGADADPFASPRAAPNDDAALVTGDTPADDDSVLGVNAPSAGAQMPAIAVVETTSIVRENCSDHEYAVLFTTNCFTCPEGGRCDGSWQLGVAPGYWREPSMNYTQMRYITAVEESTELRADYTTFYKCHIFDACKGGDVDTFNVCNEGYNADALLCTSCESGYGFSGRICESCPVDAFVWLGSLGLVVAAGLVFLIVAYYTLIENVKGGNADSFVQMKQVFSWLQSVAATSGRVEGLLFPDDLNFFSTIRKMFYMHREVNLFQCLARTDFYGQWLAVMVVPPAFAVLAGLASMVVRIAKFQQRQYRLKRKNRGRQNPEGANLKVEFTGVDPDEILEDEEKKVQDSVVKALAKMTKASAFNRGDAPSKDNIFITPTFPDLHRGTHGELLASISALPQTDVVLIPSGPGLTFVPPVLTFTTNTQCRFSVVGSIPGPHEVTWRVSGTDKRKYHVPDTSPVLVFDEFQVGAHDMFLNAVTVMFFFAMPWLLSAMADLIACDAIMSDGTEYLRADATIECYNSEYWLHVGFSVLLCVLYIIAIPIGTFFYLRKKRENFCEARVRAKFGFLFRGFKHKFWYWEFVVMTRKAIIVLISSISQSMWTRIYVVQWVLVFYLGCTVWNEPYMNTINYASEILLLVAHSATLNLALVYFTDDLQEWITDSFGLLIVIVNFATLVVLLFAFVLIWKGRLAAQTQHKSFQRLLIDDNFEEADVQHMTWKRFFGRIGRSVANKISAIFGWRRRKLPAMHGELGGAATFIATRVFIKERKQTSMFLHNMAPERQDLEIAFEREARRQDEEVAMRKEVSGLSSSIADNESVMSSAYSLSTQGSNVDRLRRKVSVARQPFSRIATEPDKEDAAGAGAGAASASSQEKDEATEQTYTSDSAGPLRRRASRSGKGGRRATVEDFAKGYIGALGAKAVHDQQVHMAESDAGSDVGSPRASPRRKSSMRKGSLVRRRSSVRRKASLGPSAASTGSPRGSIVGSPRQNRESAVAFIEESNTPRPSAAATTPRASVGGATPRSNVRDLVASPSASATPDERPGASLVKSYKSFIEKSANPKASSDRHGKLPPLK